MFHVGPSFRASFPLVGTLFLMGICGALAACNRSGDDVSASSKGALPPPTASGNNPIGTSSLDSSANAKKLLQDVAAAYSSARTYADAGKLLVQYKAGDEPRTTAFAYATTFVRPNKIRLHCYAATIVCDGKDFRATLANLAGQVLSLKAPEVLDEGAFRSDGVLATSLNEGGPAGAPLMPALLTDSKLIEEVFLKLGKMSLLEPVEIDGAKYDRVLVSFAENGSQGKEEVLSGEYTFFIDRATKTLRRLEMPLHPDSRKQYESNGIKDVHMIADFVGAKLNSEIPPVAFEFALPKDGKLVKRLQWELPPHAPSELLGKTIGDFVLSAAKGEKITRDSISGKTVVLDFWSQGFEPSAQILPLMSQVAEQFKDNDKVAFYAVNMEGPTAKVESLEQALKAWKCDLPLARDLDDQTSKVFGEKPYPFYMVLGPDGKVQEFEAGFNPNLKAELPQTIKKILAGENTFENAQKRFEVAQKNYDDLLRRANEGEGSIVVEVPKIVVAPRTEPEKLKLTKLWTATDLKGVPGNILLVRQESDWRAVVLDNWREVAEFDANGKLLARHDLRLTEEAVVSFLRTAVNREGKRYFAGFANYMPQLFLYDEKWGRVLAYPENEKTRIADVRFASLDGSGEPSLLVGYWEDVGVQGVSLAGKRLWGNRSMQTTMSLAISGADASGKQNLLCVNGSESIGRFDHEGKLGEYINLPGRAIEWIAVSSFNKEEETKTVVISAHDPQKSYLIGLDAKGGEQWSYPFLKGIPQKPVERIVRGSLADGRDVWMLTGPDGSIHFLLSDGKLLDKFNYGFELTGVALDVVDGKTVLLVASVSGLTAWQVEP